MKLTDEAGRPRGVKGRPQRRCIACGRVFLRRNVMVSTVGLCVECSYRSPFAWRTVYDRDLQIGQIPSNLAPAR
ncbi:MAG: hypothetical protein ACREQT_01730 [Candidatus Binataceae bacterium]